MARFYSLHKNNPRLYIERKPAMMKSVWTSKHRREVAGELRWQASEYDYDCYNDDDDYDDTECDNNNVNNDNPYQDEECYIQSNAPIIVDLWAIPTKNNRTTKKKNNTGKKNQQRHDEQECIAIECSYGDANKEMEHLPKAPPCSNNNDILISSLLVDTVRPPRLVRSKSWSPGNADIIIPASLSLKTTLLRSKSVSQEDAHTPLHVPMSAAHCVQSLLPNHAQASVLGPTPRASLTLVSDQGRAAVLVLWTMGELPKVVPLVGCDWEVAGSVQEDICSELAQSCTVDNSFSSYLMISEHLCFNRTEWTTRLTARVSKVEIKERRWKPLTLACNKNQVMTGRTLDQFDLFQRLESKKHLVANTLHVEEESKSAEFSNDRVCLVCFDPIEQEHARVSQLMPCGHYVCSDCFVGYFESAARSGEYSIRCPAPKCTTTLGVVESAHLLCQDGRSSVFGKLNEFEQTRKGVQLCGPSARFCPTASCGHVLVPTHSTAAAAAADRLSHGCNLMMCGSCGISLCGNCNNVSHLGLSCPDFANLRKQIDSGRFDSEVLTVQWVVRHSRPCPSCRYPIERSSGCNHVRCIQCQYYFCWMCGGLGNECMAYSCTKPTKYWDKDRDYDEGNRGGMANIVHQYRAYLQTEAQLNYLRRVFQIDCDIEVLKMQIQQVILWMHAANLIGVINKSSGIVVSPLQNLELLVHALSLRQVMKDRQIMDSDASSFGLDEVVSAMGVQPKQLSKRKQQAKEKYETTRKAQQDRFSSGGSTLFHSLIADQYLADLCTMSDLDFGRKAKFFIQEGIQSLLPNIPSAVHSQNTLISRHSKKTKQKPEDTEPPRKTHIRRSHTSWKSDQVLSDISDEDFWSDDGIRSNKRTFRSKKTNAIVHQRR